MPGKFGWEEEREELFMQTIFANDADHIIPYGKCKTSVLLQGAALFAALASSQAQCLDFGTKQ